MTQQPTDRKRVLRVVLTIAVLGFAIHVLLPQVGEIGDAFTALRGGRWRYLGVALIGAATTYAAGAWMVQSSTRLKLPFWPTYQAQVAASSMATVTPAGLGWVAVTDTYLRKAGADESTAHSATTINMIITFLSHIGLLAVLAALIPTLDIPPITLPSSQVIIEVTLAGLLLIGLLFWIPASRRRILSELAGMVRSAPEVLGDRRRAAKLVTGAIAANLAFAIALTGSVAAYGPTPSPVGVLVAYMLAASVAAISPTPGGLGAMEAALTAALVRLGVSAGEAVAATLTFRLFTFWLPLPLGAWFLRRGRRLGWL